MPQTCKVYVGARSARGEVSVKVVGEDGRARELALRLDLFNHSPTGFEWGYAGSGPAQLALAILADSLGDALAVEWHQSFKFDRLAALPRGPSWSLTVDEVRSWLAGVQAAKATRDARTP